jgi:Ca2+-binding RTX toxin-like protein
VNIGQAFAEDDCGGAVTITNNAPATFPLGVTTVTWTAVDARGNTKTATQRITALLGDSASCCPAGTNVILGTSNNDTLNGTNGSDCILGRGSQDTINGNGGNDFISGGDGNDNVTGGTGNDSIFAGSGQDVVNGNEGDDTLFGGDGDDTVVGGIGNDVLRGGQGQDLLQGQDGNDLLFGEQGADTLQGGNGNDNLAGGPNVPGDDTCTDTVGTNTFAQCELGGNADSCSDSVKNGTETGLDCGGGCKPCDSGGACLSSPDCLSKVCAASVCQDLLYGVQVTPVVDTDWGAGYCVRLEVTNLGDVATTNWTATLNTNQATIYTSFNGNFSGSSGLISVTPANQSNRVLDPNETDGSIGFCANRNVAGSGTLPFITGAVGTF